MTAVSTVGLVACAIFGTAMLHVVVTDLRHRRIRNWLVGGLAACWAPLALAAGLPAAEMAMAAGAAALVFAGGFACFAAGWLGGGDVKLAAVAVLWLGAGLALPFLLLASLLGAASTLAVLAARTIRRRAPSDAPPPREVPYGPALAATGIALLHGSPWAVTL